MKKQPSAAQLRWWASDKFKAIGSATARQNLLAFAAAPKCGATRKYDGQPCQMPGLGAGGRCRWHGGATPSGKGWHKPRWPDGPAPDAEKRVVDKLKKRERAEKRRQAALAKMSPAERQAHRLWQRTHRPGSAAKREADRLEALQNIEAREILTRPGKPQPQNEEAEALRTRIDELNRLLEKTEREYREGVFE